MIAPWTADAPDKHWVEEEQGFCTYQAFETFVRKGEQV
jgi:hypothetical protein